MPLPENQQSTQSSSTPAPASSPAPSSGSSSSGEQQPTAKEGQDAFESAFSSDGTQSEPSPARPASAAPAGEPTKKQEAKPALQQPAAPASGTPEPEDKPVLAGFTEKQIKQLLGEVPENSKRFREYSTQLRQVNGWIGSIRASLKALEEKGKTPAATQGSAAGKPIDSEAMRKLREDLPDVAAAIESMMAGMQPGAAGISKQELEAYVAQRVSAAQSEWRGETTKLQLRSLWRAHPDLRELAGKAAKGTKLADLVPGYKLWLAAQPSDYQEEVNNAEDYDTVSESFTKFKTWQGQHQQSQGDAEQRQREEAERKAAEAKRQRSSSRLENAVAPTGVPATGPTTESGEAAFQRAFGG